MTIRIKHKFSDRLYINDESSKIDTIIIGTFNPGLPNSNILTEQERKQFLQVSNSTYFKSAQEILNLYDRSNNRFWKVMDMVNNHDFYKVDIKRHNPVGLKYYKSNGMDRHLTFERQKQFCKDKNILITDTIIEIEPKSFDGIYDYYNDKVIDGCVTMWNTTNIINMIKQYNPKRVLVNFNYNGLETPNINYQISILRNTFAKLNIQRILSPSGAAKNSYVDLYNDWNRKLNSISFYEK
ncbi:MAG: hypothetical protein CVT97_02980 [Bacteroidetes bacterium HGW-Bacteroidetes-14]|jgi:hypothetical protein|nr:MAG: hypothetical protein CVT97_02980 [Bacteroidetes bacterium HGW-Bacteroidetes-14]